MASTALSILSVDEMKQELRLPSTYTGDDNLIENIINRSVDAVSNDTGLALVDKLFDAYSPIPSENSMPLRVNVKDFVFDPNNNAHRIEYWTNQHNLNDIPDGSINNNEIGRVVHVPGGTLIYISTEWPDDYLSGTNAEIIGSVGIDVDEIPVGIKTAIIIMARFLYSGDSMMPQRSAYDRLIDPYRRITPL